MSGALVELANLAVTQGGLQGIDWAALNAAGRGSVWDRDYIDQYMVPAQGRMMTVLMGLDLNIVANPVDFTDNYTVNEDLLTDLGQVIVSMGNPVGLLAMKIEARLSRESMRYLIAHASAIANYGMLLHTDETIHHSGKSDQEIAAHADMVVGIMNAIAMMSAGGFFALLGITKAAATTSGLGIAQNILIGIVVVAIVLLALAAWVLVNMRAASEINHTVATMCQKAQDSGDTATTQQCVNTLTAASKDLGSLVPPGTVSAILKEVLPYALAGVGVYMLFLFAPAIVKSLMSSRTASA